jgi:hypothetical protein
MRRSVEFTGLPESDPSTNMTGMRPRNRMDRNSKPINFPLPCKQNDKNEHVDKCHPADSPAQIAEDPV